MSAKEKENLLKKLSESHLEIHQTLEKVDLEMIVYKDPIWRVREIIGHIAIWDRETTQSLRAYQAGSEYQIADLDEEETEYNAKAAEEQKRLSNQEIIAEWKGAYEEFRKAIQEMPTDLFPGVLQFPWDERGSISTLVEYMIEHAVEHNDEILKAMQE